MITLYSKKNSKGVETSRDSVDSGIAVFGISYQIKILKGVLAGLKKKYKVFSAFKVTNTAPFNFVTEKAKNIRSFVFGESSSDSNISKYKIKHLEILVYTKSILDCHVNAIVNSVDVSLSFKG